MQCCHRVWSAAGGVPPSAPPGAPARCRRRFVSSCESSPHGVYAVCVSTVQHGYMLHVRRHLTGKEGDRIEGIYLAAGWWEMYSMASWTVWICSASSSGMSMTNSSSSISTSCGGEGGKECRMAGGRKDGRRRVTRMSAKGARVARDRGADGVGTMSGPQRRQGNRDRGPSRSGRSQ